jgi:hypothetical protein
MILLITFLKVDIFKFNENEKREKKVTNKLQYFIFIIILTFVRIFFALLINQ